MRVCLLEVCLVVLLLLTWVLLGFFWSLFILSFIFFIFLLPFFLSLILLDVIFRRFVTFIWFYLLRFLHDLGTLLLILFNSFLFFSFSLFSNWQCQIGWDLDCSCFFPLVQNLYFFLYWLFCLSQNILLLGIQTYWSDNIIWNHILIFYDEVYLAWDTF